MSTKLGVYQITDIGPMDAFYNSKERMIGEYFKFTPESNYFSIADRNDEWEGASSINLLSGIDSCCFFQFKFRRIL